MHLRDINIRVHFVFDVKHCGKFKQDLWLMDILPTNQLKLFTQELFHSGTLDWLCSLLNLIIFNSEEQMLEMHTSKHSQKKALHCCWLRI